MRGLVLSGANNLFQVECEDGFIRQCTIKGKVLEQDIRYHNPLAPGDFVEVEIDEHDLNEAQVLEMLPRKNFFARLNEKTLTPQILAANIDLLLCITTPDEPPFRPIFVDRVLVQAAWQNIPVLIVLNKIDLKLSKKKQVLVDAHLAEWQRLKYQLVKTSASTGEGLQELVKMINGKTICIAGQSGVGKSSLLNAIDSGLSLATGKVSEKYNKGSHTTTRGSFYKINKKFGNKNLQLNIIDTPGIKNFSLYGIERDEIALYFPEMAEAVGKCKFGLSCSHTVDAGCEIVRLLDEGKISDLRYKSWLNMTE
ncbi:MAG: ribosome small subunit-dependent GTPase A [Treponemataceae bacterium]